MGFSIPSDQFQLLQQLICPLTRHLRYHEVHVLLQELEELLPALSRFVPLNLDLVVREEMVGLLEALSDGSVKVVLDTNTNFSNYRSLYGKNGALKMMRKYRIFASCYARFAKPDPRYFGIILDAANTAPEDALFIDDRPEYIEGARKARIPFIVYRSAGDIRNYFDGLEDDP